MSVVSGIDEAGFGPLLGPLVVSTAAIALPARELSADMWDLLAPVVTKRRSRRKRALHIADSKKVFTRGSANALASLERGVLAMLATRGVKPDSLRDLLKVISPGTPAKMDEYPWYAGADLPLPRCADETDVALTANALAVAMKDASLALTAMRSEVIFVGEYNRTVSATQNKSVTLFDINSRLLYYLWGRLWKESDDLARIYADRLGGRKRYLGPLQRVLPDCSFKVLDENDELSGYRITDGARVAELFYGVGFDRHHLTVAYASMVSKYLRELFMEIINSWWAGRVPGLAPTAGYYTDGKRFLEDISSAIESVGVDISLIRRSR